MKLDLVFPCQEDTNNMKDTANGKFCGQCNKEVIDFTEWGKEDIVEYLSKKKSCGIFRNEVLDSVKAKPIVHIKARKNYISRMIASISVLVLALTSCDRSAPQDKTVGILVPDTKQVEKTNCTQTLGVPLKPTIEEVVDDVPEIIEEDSLVTVGEMVAPPVVGQSKMTPTSGIVGISIGTEAQFPGGEDSMMNFLAQNIEYPKHEEKEGVIYAGFDVLGSGELENIKIMHSFDDAERFEKEVIRVIKTMPNWLPAESEGVPVKSNYVLPISFSQE